MISARVAELSRKLTDVRLAERRDELMLAVDRHLSEMTVRGMGRSGAAFLGVQILCVKDITVATEGAWQSLWRVVSNLGIQPSPGLAEDLKVELRAQLEPHIAHVKSVLETDGPRALGGPAGELLDQARDALRAAFEQALTKVSVEIDLFVESSLRLAQGGAPGPVFNIYSPVGAILTGANATANVIQNLDQDDRAALLRALVEFKQSVTSQEGLAPRARSEIVELIDEGAAELAREKPNSLRLTSVLTAVATTVQTAAGLQPAYQALKAVLAPLGISLP